MALLLGGSLFVYAITLMHAGSDHFIECKIVVCLSLQYQYLCCPIGYRGCIHTGQPECVEGFFEFSLCESYSNSLWCWICTVVCVRMDLCACMLVCTPWYV